MSLVRAPTGIIGELFFQKHLEAKMPGITELDPALWPGHGGLLAIDSKEDLLASSDLQTTWYTSVDRCSAV